MTEITDAAVEGAARAAYARILFGVPHEFDHADPTVQDLWRSIARAALTAALPYLVAAEREACAQQCDDTAISGDRDWDGACFRCATAIRARKDTDRV